MTNEELLPLEEFGQVWTPASIAREMAKEVFALCPNAKRVLDPACGPATFAIAMHSIGIVSIDLICYDVDERMTKFSLKTNRKLGISGAVRLADYLADTKLEGSFDAVIMNPPYVRQEEIDIDSKDNYHKYLKDTFGVDIDRRANLFALFMLKGLVDLVPNGVLSAIVYDAITQSGYGKKILQLMGRHAELISSRQIKAPFDGVLVDAQILLFRKREKPLLADAVFQGGLDDGLVSLDTLLETRRGTGFPLRKLFFAKEADPYFNHSESIFVKQSTLAGLIVKADQRAYMTDTVLDSKVIVWLQGKAKEQEVSLAKHSIRGVKGPIVFNYYIRNAPRHLWNPENIAVADNFYVSIPKRSFPSEVAWLLLNSNLYLSKIRSAARSQGNGLLKLQLYEYKKVRIPDWSRLPKRKISMLSKASKELIDRGASYEVVRESADRVTRGLFDA